MRRTSFVFAAVLAAASACIAAGGPPAHAAAPAGSVQTRINHVVVMMQENRSYDSYFARLHYQGQPASSIEPLGGNPNPLRPFGAFIHPFLNTHECEVADLAHSWNAVHQEIDGGKMDGFTAANQDPADPTGSRAMSYYGSSILSFYYGLANQFSIADRYFASVPGPTFPNRFYLLTGTSFGHIQNDFPPAGGFTQKTIFQALDEASPPVSWRIYLETFGVEQLFSYVQQHGAGHVFPLSQYYADAAAGHLPQVSFVESNGIPQAGVEDDEHPPSNVQVGAKFTHDVMNALVQSPNWPSSALFLTYDEHGGFYDHVAPPAAVTPDDIPPMLGPNDTQATFDSYGVRVPAIVVSPFAKPHFVSHTVYDHTSILKFIETRFGIPPLTRRDAAADPMLGMFDFTKESFAHPILPNAPVDPAGVAACAALGD